MEYLNTKFKMPNKKIKKEKQKFASESVNELVNLGFKNDALNGLYFIACIGGSILLEFVGQSFLNIHYLGLIFAIFSLLAIWHDWYMKTLLPIHFAQQLIIYHKKE